MTVTKAMNDITKIVKHCESKVWADASKGKTFTKYQWQTENKEVRTAVCGYLLRDGFWLNQSKKSITIKWQ